MDNLGTASPHSIQSARIYPPPLSSIHLPSTLIIHTHTQWVSLPNYRQHRAQEVLLAELREVHLLAHPHPLSNSSNSTVSRLSSSSSMASRSRSSMVLPRVHLLTGLTSLSRVCLRLLAI
jgi:hypothetical protein